MPIFELYWFEGLSTCDRSLLFELIYSSSKENILNVNSSKKLTALVVEDDLDSLEILTNILENTSNIHCETARTGKQAIEYFNDTTPAITFLDIDIPAPNGLDTLKQIRHRHATAKVVMVTGIADINTVKEAIKLGAFGYIVKPFVPEKIIDILRKI